MAIWVVVLASWIPHTVLDRMDVAELNHVICPTSSNEQGVYWVWWRWENRSGVVDYYVVDWRRESDAPQPTDGAQEFWDARTKTHRYIESRVFVETWTLYDRESEDRKRLPEDKRRKLRKGFSND